MRRHKQKTVDLSIPFRASGLVGGAKLELVQKSKTPSAVQIGLQLPQPEAKEIPGGRLVKKFPSDLTLWGVMRQFESGDASAGRNINITARGVARTTGGAVSGSGQLFYERPVLNIMGRDFTTFEDFQKTLAQLGHNSGSVLLRLTFKQTDETLFDAMAQISQLFKETREGQSAPAAEPEPAPTAQQAAREQGPDTPMADAPQETTDAAEATPITTEAAPAAEPVDPYEPVGVFLAPSTSTPAAALAPAEESDFTPTIAHAKLHQSRLQDSARNRRLPSDKEMEERQAEEAARVAAIKSVLIKIRFPDNTSSDWQIDHSSTGAFLYEAVRHVMADPKLPFHLVLPGGGGAKNLLKDDSGPKHNLIEGYKLQGRVLINLVWNDEVPLATRKLPFLKANVAKQGQAIKVPEMPKAAPEEPAPAPKKQEEGEEGETRKEDKGKKVPKWLKLGKK